MPQIDITFTWIGPPSQLIGHDTDGPSEFLELFNGEEFSQATHRMTFFCLKKHYSHYHAFFQNQPIAVTAIEDYLQQIISSGTSMFIEQARALLDLIKRFTAPDRDSIRDRVTVKNLLHFFLSFYNGGYFFDTNIKPDDGFITLPAQTLFTICQHYGDSPSKDRNFSIDIFAMYSPIGDQLAKSIFDKYLAGLHTAEAIVDKRSRAYYFAMISNISQSVYELWKATSISWKTKRLNDKTLSIPSLNVLKEQENTHKYDLRKTYDRDKARSMGSE